MGKRRKARYSTFGEGTPLFREPSAELTLGPLPSHEPLGEGLLYIKTQPKSPRAKRAFQIWMEQMKGMDK